jgi:hypothetical protein
MLRLAELSINIKLRGFWLNTFSVFIKGDIKRKRIKNIDKNLKSLNINLTGLFIFEFR